MKVMVFWDMAPYSLKGT